MDACGQAADETNPFMSFREEEAWPALRFAVGSRGHAGGGIIKDGNRVLNKDSFLAPTRVLMKVHVLRVYQKY